MRKERQRRSSMKAKGKEILPPGCPGYTHTQNRTKLINSWVHPLLTRNGSYMYMYNYMDNPQHSDPIEMHQAIAKATLTLSEALCVCTLCMCLYLQ